MAALRAECGGPDPAIRARRRPYPAPTERGAARGSRGPDRRILRATPPSVRATPPSVREAGPVTPAVRPPRPGATTTRLRPRRPEQQAHEGGLPGPVQADQRVDLARDEVQVDAGHGRLVAEALGDAVGAQQRDGEGGGHRGPPV